MWFQEAVEAWLTTAIDARFIWRDSKWGESNWSSGSRIDLECV